MNDMNRARFLVMSATLALAACGGGGGDASPSQAAASPGTGSTLSATGPGAVSTGTISAFGSVFVNGHEFATHSVSVIDDDTGAASTSTAALEVGMVVDVKAASTSTATTPVASELHLNPLARGYVDSVGTSSAGRTLTVLGQTVQTTASTSFADHRVCVAATTSPCVAVTGASGLSATTGSGTSAVAGSYVTVHGYLYATGTSPTTANIVATLVSVADAPSASANGAVFKAEGTVTATGASSITLGGLNVGLGSAVCRASGTVVACANAFTVGQIVSVYAATAPSLPATTFAASTALSRSTVPVATAGATVEIEGSVSAVTATAPANFTVRGITVDASSLPTGTALPTAGDIVKVLGTVTTSGTSVAATSLTVLRHSQSTTYAFEGDLSGVAAGAAASTYTAAVLGQLVTVGSSARLVDLTTRSAVGTSTNPFNITTFASYLAASASKHVVVQAYVDTASGTLNVISLAIVPASSVDALSGPVDATPAPVNSAATGTPSAFAIHGVAVGADPAAIRSATRATSTNLGATIATGDEVTAFGIATAAGTGLTVGATPSRTNLVIDYGPVRVSGRDDSGF